MTCLRLLERAATAANIALNGATPTAALSMTMTKTTNVVGIPTPDDSEEASPALAGGGRQPPAAQDVAAAHATVFLKGSGDVRQIFEQNGAVEDLVGVLMATARQQR